MKEQLEGTAGGATEPLYPPYDVLICVDFEATCDELQNGRTELLVTRDQQEIIEFPWVVLDTASLEVLPSQPLLPLP